METDKAQFSSDQYNAFIKKIRIEKIELHNLICEKKKVKLEGKEIVAKVQLSLNEPELIADELTDDIEIEVIGSIDDEDVFSIKCRFSLVYHLQLEQALPNDLVSEMAKHFIRNNAVMHLWPYFRETVASLTTKMGFYPPLIPGLMVYNPR